MLQLIHSGDAGGTVHVVLSLNPLFIDLTFRRIKQGEDIDRLFQLLLVSGLSQPLIDANIAGGAVHIHVFAAVLADIGHDSQLVTGFGNFGDIDDMRRRVKNGLPVAHVIQHHRGVAPVLRVGIKHTDINVALDIFHGVLQVPVAVASPARKSRSQTPPPAW